MKRLADSLDFFFLRTTNMIMMTRTTMTAITMPAIAPPLKPPDETPRTARGYFLMWWWVCHTRLMPLESPLQHQPLIRGTIGSYPTPFPASPLHSHHPARAPPHTNSIWLFRLRFDRCLPAYPISLISRLLVAASNS